MKKNWDREIWNIGLSALMFLSLSAVWMSLEVMILGGVDGNLIDSIISIPIFISFYFNAKALISKLKESQV